MTLDELIAELARLRETISGGARVTVDGIEVSRVVFYSGHNEIQLKT